MLKNGSSETTAPRPRACWRRPSWPPWGAPAQEVTGVLGSPSATDHARRIAAAAARPEVRRRDQGARLGVDALVGAAGRAAQGRAERAADHDRRRRLRRALDLRRGDPDADARRARGGGAALHQLPLDLALLADAGGADHRPQPPFGGVRRRGRDRDRLPGLRLDHPRSRRATIGTILRENGYATSWFGKDHNTPFYQASQAGPFDQWPNGMGFEYFYGFVGGDASQWQPNLFRNTTAIYPFRGQSRLEPDHGDGRRGDRPHAAAEGGRAGQAVLRLLRSGRHPCAAPPDAGMDQEDQRHAPVRRRLEQAARHHVRQPEAPRGHARERRADALAGQPAGVGHAERGGEDALPPAGGRLRRLHGLHRPRDRPRRPGRRGHGRARQHADHLHRRRQRRERGGHAERHAERVHHLQRRRGAGEGPDALVSVLGLGADLPAFRRRLGLGHGHAVQMGEAGRLALRRHRARAW